MEKETKKTLINILDAILEKERYNQLCPQTIEELTKNLKKLEE